jgi:hypothetical protein
MNVGDERTMSCWMGEVPVMRAPQLKGDEACDVVIIGPAWLVYRLPMS